MSCRMNCRPRAGRSRTSRRGTLNAPPELFLVLCSTGYDISMNTKKWCQSAMDSPIFQREEEVYATTQLNPNGTR